MSSGDRRHTSRPDAFDRAIAIACGSVAPLGDSGFYFQFGENSRLEERIDYLASAAVRLEIPYERFLKGAQRVLGGDELNADDYWNLRRQFYAVEQRYGRKVSLAELKAEEKGKQPGSQKTRDKEREM